MNGVRQGWLVAKRELRERSRSRAFLASLAVMVIAVVGVIALPSILDTSGAPKTWASPAPPRPRSPTPSPRKETPSAPRPASTTTTQLPKANKPSATARSTCSSSTPASSSGRSKPTSSSRRSSPQPSRSAPFKHRAAAVGITDTQLGALLAPVTVSNVELGQVAGDRPDDETAAFIMTVLLFMTIATYGAMVLNGVVEEKASRVVEVLLARIPARSLLAGKITGIGLLGLGQVAVTALAALIAATTISGVDLPAVRGGVLAWAVVWFVLGYALYATVFGALGSLASRPEDAQSAAGPVSVLLVLVYFVSFAAIGSPDTTWARADLVASHRRPHRHARPHRHGSRHMVGSRRRRRADTRDHRRSRRARRTHLHRRGPSQRTDAQASRHLAHRTPTPRPQRSSPTNVERHSPTTAPRRQARSAVIALLVATAVGGLTIIVTNDVIIGVAVGAALFAVIDRVTKAWRQPPPADPQAGTDLVDAGANRAKQGGRR